MSSRPPFFSKSHKEHSSALQTEKDLLLDMLTQERFRKIPAEQVLKEKMMPETIQFIETNINELYQKLEKQDDDVNRICTILFAVITQIKQPPKVFPVELTLLYFQYLRMLNAIIKLGNQVFAGIFEGTAEVVFDLMNSSTLTSQSTLKTLNFNYTIIKEKLTQPGIERALGFIFRDFFKFTEKMLDGNFSQFSWNALSSNESSPPCSIM